MDVNQYLIDRAWEFVVRTGGQDATLRSVADQLIVWKYYDAADAYLRPFKDYNELDKPLPSAETQAVNSGWRNV